MSHSPNLFPLKLLVICLGLVMLGGIIFVLTVIATRAKEEMHAAHCPDATMHLAGSGELVSVTPQGKEVQLTLRSGAASMVLTVDRCSGNILQTLTIAP